MRVNCEMLFNKGQPGHLAQAWETSSGRPSVADGLTYSFKELSYSPHYKISCFLLNWSENQKLHLSQRVLEC